MKANASKPSNFTTHTPFVASNTHWIKSCFVSLVILLFMVGCGDSQPLTAERYLEPLDWRDLPG